MKIATKISIVFFAIAIILTGTIAPMLYMTARNNLEKAIFAHLSTTAQSRARHIEEYLRMYPEKLEQLSQRVILKELLVANKEDEDYEQKLTTAVRRVKDTAEIAEDLYGLLVLDKNGIIVVSSEETNIGEDKSADSYFLEAKSKPFVKDAYYSEKAEEGLIAFSAPVTDKRRGELLGVIVAENTLDKLNKITTDRTGLGKTGDIYIVNKYGYMITPSRFKKINS